MVTKGSSLGRKLVRELLECEAEALLEIPSGEIRRVNNDFAFLRRQNSGVASEYVLEIFPERKENHLLHGQIWVDVNSFRIRRLEGMPARNPSFWLKDSHITLQFAQLEKMWIPVTFDGAVTVRFLRPYTLSGFNIRSSELKLSRAPQ